MQRSQTNVYNNQGWLAGVSADARFDAGGGASLNQQLAVSYQFDASGNRVQISNAPAGGAAAETGSYSYDASGRMLSGRDDKRNEVVNSLSYDGFGNRISESRTGETAPTTTPFTSYSYDANNRVLSSSAGEAWGYDANGNTTSQTSRDGSTSSTAFNAENRSTSSSGGGTTSSSTYDAAGNVTSSRVDGDGFGFTEVTQRDVRYLEVRKDITESWAKGAARLEGATSFSYDANGNLAFLDRGRKQGAGQNSVAYFDYDLEGQIIGRADKASALSNAAFFAGYSTDPDAVAANGDNSEGGFSYFNPSETQNVQRQLFGSAGGTSASTSLQSYLYANNKPISQAAGNQSLALKKLTLQGGQPIQTPPDPFTGEQAASTGSRLSLQESDIARTAGVIDRTATARNIAARAYAGPPGFAQLSTAAQEKVVAYVQAQLPPDAELIAGAQIELHAFILMVDASYTGLSQITDYSLRQLGSDGIPGGTVQSHVVRPGDTLQTIAQIYFGSPAYWYLIADANGLSGSERLAEGVTLTIPNQVANSANSAQTFKVYNESEIIGSTSPEIRTVAKKKKWWQKLIMIIIIVILIIATIYTAGAASGAWGAAGAAAGTGTAAGGAAVAGGTAAAGGAAAGTVAAGAVTAGTVAATTVAAASVGGTIFAAGSALGASLAAGLGYAGALAVAAGVGAATFAAASVLTQGLAIAAGLQEDFNWKAVGKAAVGGAVSGAASFLTAGFAAGNAVANASRTTEIATRVGVETGRQLITDGKINNVAGLIGAAAAGGAFSSWGTAGTFIGNNARSFGAGLSLLESKARGQGDNTMGWVGLATSALFDSGAVSPQLSNASGDLNYRLIALQAIGAAVVSSRLGSEAGTSYFGNALGSEIVETIFGRAAAPDAEPGDRLGQFIEQNQPAWEQRQANVDQLVGAFSNPGPVDRSGDVLLADAGDKLRLSNARSTDDDDYYGNIINTLQARDARRQTASAAYAKESAQTTSNLYASGAGDVRGPFYSADVGTGADAAAPGIQFDTTTGQWGYDQGNGTWTFPIEDRRQNVSSTALNSEGFNGALPPIENAYRPLEGFFEGRYKMAVNGLTDPNASLLDKAFYTVAGAGVLIPSLLEAPVTGLYNFANNAAIAGQYAARADLQADPSDATIDRLSAVVYGSQAAGGLLGAASMVPGVVKFGPRVNTSEELAVSQYSGAEATAAARASYAGEIGLKQPSFANRFPEDALSLQPVPTLTQDQALRIPKNILYVVREDGSLVLSPRPSSGAYGHIDLASGGNVLAAGEGKILWGEVKSFDNASGHYLPQGAGARTAAEKAFSDYGFKVPASAYTEKIYDFGLGKWVKK